MSKKGYKNVANGHYLKKVVDRNIGAIKIQDIKSKL